MGVIKTIESTPDALIGFGLTGPARAFWRATTARVEKANANHPQRR
jgi:hypothetical protein